MKKIFKYLLIISLGVIIFTSCEEDTITLEEKIVGFAEESGVISEPSSAAIAIPVYNAATSGSGCTVAFTFSVEGINNPAIEGIDFTVVNASNSLTFDSYYETDTIFILPIDNGLYEGNKSVNIILSAPSNGFELTNESTYVLTIVDDEHPLALWIGSYSVDAKSFLNPGAWDEVWSVTTVPNPDDDTQLLMIGIAGSTEAVIATFNTDNMTVSIDAGSELGDPYGWTDVAIYGYDAGIDAILTSGTVDGTITNDGTIVFSYMAISALINPTVNNWDIFTPTFTKN